MKIILYIYGTAAYKHHTYQTYVTAVYIVHVSVILSAYCTYVTNSAQICSYT